MDSYKEVFYAAGLPALISTWITLVYFLLKAYQFAVYVIATNPSYLILCGFWDGISTCGCL